MTSRGWMRTAAALAALGCVGGRARAGEGSSFGDGRWGFELAGYRGLSKGYLDRSGDRGLVLSVEYEAPLYERFALGLRAEPVFYYRDELEHMEIWGAAAGAVFRVYQIAEKRRGFYGEIGASVLGTTDRISHNSSELNFVSEVGVGYRFGSSFHVALKLRHISNAGIDNQNSGANGVGLAFGFSL